ncbi:MAG: hypothetical protein LKE51_00870 [Selenomonas sp.]|jgi:hypothetical protein|nr:hypothetical protein [Selenomonas sp.]
MRQTRKQKRSYKRVKWILGYLLDSERGIPGCDGSITPESQTECRGAGMGMTQ